MKIVFLVAKRNKPHEGVVRPFLNLTSGLRGIEMASVALFRCGPEIIDYVNELDIPFCISNNKTELLREIEGQHPDFVICDDNFLSLGMLNSFKKKVRTNCVVYVQALYGAHAIGDCFDLSYLGLKEKIAFSSSRFIPFSLLIRRYTKALNNCDMVIANSNTTASILQTFYGVSVHGVVYPPIDTEVFKHADHTKNPMDVTLYLGSRAGDTQANLVQDIVSRVQNGNYKINLFGMEKLAVISKERYSGLTFYSDVEDKQLAELYSRSLLTVCPQRWETFGFVPVESMSCGTPSLVFNCMGLQETFTQNKTGWAVNSDEEFLSVLGSILRREYKFPSQDELRKYAIDNFSIKASVKQLLSHLAGGSEK